MLPRPVAILGALALTAGTGVAIRLLPADAAAPPRAHPPPSAQTSGQNSGQPSGHTSGHHPAAVSPAAAAEPAASFVGFVDTARKPGFDLPAEARRTGVRHYALGHLVAGGDDGCSPKWLGPPAGPDEPDAQATGPDQPDAEGSTGPDEAGSAGTGSLESGVVRRDRLDPGENPVANRIGHLRALGGDAAPVFGGPEGDELAATCLRPGGLTAAYRRVVGAFDATTIDFEIHGDDGATALRRARAVRALQRERPLQVSFTLPLRTYGLETADAAMLRIAHQAGAEIGIVNLLAAIPPRTAGNDRLRRLAEAVRLAREQIARAQDLPDPGQAWRGIALTPVLAGGGDLDELDARTLAAYAARHGLAWLSLRGAAPSRQVTRILRGAA